MLRNIPQSRLRRNQAVVLLSFLLAGAIFYRLQRKTSKARLRHATTTTGDEGPHRFQAIPISRALVRLFLREPVTLIATLGVIGTSQCATFLSFLWLFRVLYKNTSHIVRSKPGAFLQTRRAYGFHTLLIKTSLLTSYCSLEVFFYFYQLWLLSRVNNEQDPSWPKVPALSSDNIDDLIGAYTDTATSLQKQPRQWLSNWFYRTPFAKIGLHNTKQWASFAFYGTDYASLRNAAQRQSILRMLERCDSKFNLNLLETSSAQDTQTNNTLDRLGRLESPEAENLAFMKPFLSTLHITKKPLVHYFVTGTVMPTLGHTYLSYVLGYRFVKRGTKTTTTPENSSENGVDAVQSLQNNAFDYWVYQPENVDKNDLLDPLVFIHGIGSGIVMYSGFLTYLHRNCPQLQNRCVIVLDLPWISMTYPSIHNKMPQMEQACEGLKVILKQYSVGNGCIVMGHSFGTILMAWMLKNETLRGMISKAVFIEPVCFELYEPDLVFNFVYRAPTNCAQLFMWHYVCREFGVAYVIQRQFWWFQSVLRGNQCPGKALKKAKNEFEEESGQLSGQMNDLNDSSDLDDLDDFESEEEKIDGIGCGGDGDDTRVLLSEEDCLTNSKSLIRYMKHYNIEYHCEDKQVHGGYLTSKKCFSIIAEWINEWDQAEVNLKSRKTCVV